MNERIKELVVESGNGQFHNGKFYPHIGSRTAKDWEKFAELIVEECINVCKSRVGNSDYNTGRLHCVSDIRERFEFGMTTEDKKTLIKELLGVKNG